MGDWLFVRIRTRRRMFSANYRISARVFLEPLAGTGPPGRYHPGHCAGGSPRFNGRARTCPYLRRSSAYRRWYRPPGCHSFHGHLFPAPAATLNLPIKLFFWRSNIICSPLSAMISRQKRSPTFGRGRCHKSLGFQFLAGPDPDLSLPVIILFFGYAMLCDPLMGCLALWTWCALFDQLFPVSQ